MLNVKFSGNYYLLKWILKKYKDELPYAGQVKEFARENSYSQKIYFKWSHYGIN